MSNSEENAGGKGAPRAPGKFGRWIRNESGEVLGKAAPKLLREDLRRLPGNFVASDADDPDRIHELDEEHIRDTLAEDLAKAEQDDTPSKVSPDQWLSDEQPRLAQWKVDIRRMTVMRAWAETQVFRHQNRILMDFGVKHIWFPKDDHRVYELRAGNPPADADRPKHLRRFSLHIDFADGPRLIHRVMRDALSRGIKADQDHWVRRQMQEALKLNPNQDIFRL